MLNMDSSFNFGDQITGRGPNPGQGSQDLGNGLRSPSAGGQLQGFNNHVSLRNSTGIFDSPTDRRDSHEMSRGFQFQRTPRHEDRLPLDPARRERDERSVSPAGQTSTPTGPQRPPRGLASQTNSRGARGTEPPIGGHPDDNPSEVYGENNRHLAYATAHFKLLMEVVRANGKIDALSDQVAVLSRALLERAQTPGIVTGTPSAVTPGTQPKLPARQKWVASDKLLGLINPLALKLLFSPLLDAYTAIENGPEGYLPNSLFSTIKKTVAKEGVAFAAEHLPIQLLAGIHDSKMKELVDIPVPNIKGMVQRVAVRCGVAVEETNVEKVWAATDKPTRARIAYLRREAARLVLKGGQGRESIWAVVDKKLAELRMKRNEDYTTAHLGLANRRGHQGANAWRGGTYEYICIKPNPELEYSLSRPSIQYVVSDINSNYKMESSITLCFPGPSLSSDLYYR
ncbi:uncharacterized protein MELLADRAFT_108135 [Melampsora larici-populina 98AG31]|uniref:Uncharacterized protein n=1 Tax=Melampsora larici-populina (strain 98AG31 / pathotype 3-4-7) TaxID=747676 RepID=F4RS29_MELLP|nr:uncharacterized protein MELLADRAFT_108135 [Melampsora larici-populina 98AG31]EGG04850.1 hypothetical protein MELLADRAFT_108135 [Melampsora larici-populina 98AG31]